MLTQTTPTRYHPNFTYYTNDDMIGGSLKLYGEYGQSEIDLLRQHITPNLVVYDVGANIGVHTCAFADAGAEVWSFEPNPRNFELLKTNCQHLFKTHLINAAVGSFSGRTTISDFDPKRIGNYGNMHSGAGGLLCEQIQLDTFSAPDPDVIKIDVEGAELHVLLGALKRISSKQPLIYYEAQESTHLSQIYRLLTGLGYKLYWNLVYDYNPNNFKRNPENVFGVGAIFCIVAQPLRMQDFKLDPVLNAGDTWEAYCRRVNERGGVR